MNRDIDQPRRVSTTADSENESTDNEEGLLTTDTSDGHRFSSSVLRLHRALSISAQRRRSSYETALKLALREVQSNDVVTEADILKKLLGDNSERRADLLLTCDGEEAASSSQVIQELIRNDAPSILVTDDGANVDENSIVSEEPDTPSAGNQENSPEELSVEAAGSYNKLQAIAKALSDRGRSGLERLQEALQQDNLQFGLDKLFSHVLHTFHDHWSHLFEYLIPWQQVQAMFLVFCLQLVNVQQVIKFLPIFSCYVCFIAMIYYTLKMIHSRYWMKQAKLWRRLLTVFKFSRTQSSSRNRRSDDTDHEHDSTLNSHADAMDEPYAHFFLALALFVFSLALTDRRSMPDVFPMCGLSVFFSFACFISLLDKRDYPWARAASALDVFASTPLIARRLLLRFRLWRGLHSLFANIIQLRLGALKLGFGLSSAAVAGVVCSYIYAAFSTAAAASRKHHHHHRIRLLILPHFVSLAWWHVGLELMISKNCSFEWKNLILTGTIIWLILLPSWTAGAAFALLAGYRAKAALDAMDMLKILSTCIIFCSPYIYKRMRNQIVVVAEDEEEGGSTWLRDFWTNCFAGSTFWRRMMMLLRGQWKVALPLIALLVLPAAILVGGRESPDVLKRTVSNLTWAEFHQHCSSFDTNKTDEMHNMGNLLQQQISCSEFGSTVVEWSGAVETVKIVNIENFLESLFYYMPDAIGQKLRCLYGAKADAFNGTTSTRKRCSVAQYNVYTFEIEARMIEKMPGRRGGAAAAAAVLLEASDVFEAIALDLRRGDVINFTAILDDDILNYPTKLSLLQIECMKCPRVFANQKGITSRVVSEAFYSEDHWFWTKLYNACRFVFNFVFAPLITID